jgi:hypothetical protein
MRGNHRKNNGKYLFIPPETKAEAESRRSDAIKELHEVRAQQKVLNEQERNLKDEIDALNNYRRKEVNNIVYMNDFEVRS